MGKLVLNVGAVNNDKTGDTLRAGGLKIKANFEEIYQALATDGVNISGGNLLKTGDYSDLKNKPNFSTVAVSGDFFDLANRPDIGIFVGEPPNDLGVDGHVAGNVAFGANNFYVCREDYVQQAQFTSFVFLHEDTHIHYPMQARFSNASNVIAVRPGSDLNGSNVSPSVDWLVSDGATVRTITSVSEQLDGDNNLYYLCTLDGVLVSVVNTYYDISVEAPVGSYVFRAEWKPQYQSLIDAHVLGQGAHLYVTYDGYGRNVTHVVRDSINNEITITYESGSKIADYNGIIIKLDQPKIWKSIPFATTYGAAFPSGSGSSNVLSTGNVIPGALDITKSVNKLTDGEYTLADGVEGQMLYVVLKTGTIDPAAVKITVTGKCRINGAEYTNNFINPFANGSNMVQFLYTDGAWQSIGGMWD